MLEFLKGLQTKSTALLGIDISSSSIKLLELSKSGGKYKVENYATRPLPEGAVVEKNIGKLEAVGEELFKLASLVKTGSNFAAVAVPGAAVITKTIELNASLSDAEMENQITVEADQYIPYPLDEVAIDFARQRPSRKNEGMVEVLLAACKKENVDLRVDALQIGGFEATVVDIEAYAMERSFKHLCDQMDLDPNGLVAIMDIGATMTTMYILRNGSSIYTREQIFGGARLSSSIQGRYGLSPAEAEAALISGELPDSYEAEVLQPFREEMIEQVSRSLQFFFSSSQYNDVDMIVLAGGAASTKGLANAMQEALSTRTVVANPFAKMTIGSKVNKNQLKNDAASLMMACGLATRNIRDGINLLPWREKDREEAKKRFFVTLGAATAAAVVILGIGHLFMTNRISHQTARNTYLTEQIAILDGKIAEIRNLQEQKRALSERMAVIQDLQGRRPVIVRLFDELVRTLPEGVYYDSITRTGDMIALSGVADSQNRVSTLMRYLEDSEWFADADLDQITGVPVVGVDGQRTANSVFQINVRVTTAGQAEDTAAGATP